MRKNIDMKFKNFKITDFTDIFGDLRYVRDVSVVLKSGKVSFFKKQASRGCRTPASQTIHAAGAFFSHGRKGSSLHLPGQSGQVLAFIK